MLVQEVLQRTIKHFEKLKLDRPKFIAESVIASAMNWKRLDLFLKMDYPLSEKELSILRDWVKRCSTGEPLAYIEGRREFYGIDFKVEPGILIPRNETELIVDEAISFYKMLQLNEARVLDFGCGSGCIGISLLKELERSKLVGVDISKKAVEISKANSLFNEVSDRAYFIETDVNCLQENAILEFLNDQANIVVANPPYISNEDEDISEQVKTYEPHIALFAAEDGMEFYYKWIPIALKLLATPGICLFEIGWKQGGLVKNFITKNFPDTSFEILKDYNGHDRLLKLTRNMYG